MTDTGGWHVQLERAMVGERQGEAYFSKMADLLDDPREVHLLRRCAELERRMYRCALGAARDDGVRCEATADELQEWLDYAAEDSARGWTAIVTGMAEGTPAAIRRYEAMRPNAPPDRLEIVELFILHETALHEVGVLECKGDHPAALARLERAIEAVGIADRDG
jgi:hypothetical protein